MPTIPRARRRIRSAAIAAAVPVLWLCLAAPPGSGAPGPGKPGAPAAHWSFVPPRAGPLPRPRNPRLAAWIGNPIDAFVAARLEKAGLSPSPPADRATLLRRVSLDLTGLPPSPAEVAAFLADRSPDAYEKVVDRLLASPHYGERWALYWMDIVRFAETNGFELDADRPQAWRYRDYVVAALNADRPYDRFLAEQIAGDQIDPGSFELQVASGFLRAGPQHVVGGNQDPAVNRQEWLTEAVNGLGSAMMGLTIGCARCHDHKFDPLPTTDYYRLQAFLAATDNRDYPRATEAEKQAYAAAMEAHKLRLKPLQEQIEAIEKPTRDRLRQLKRDRLEPAYAAALGLPEKDRTPEQRRLAGEAQRMLNLSWDEVVAGLPPDDRERRAALRRRMHAIELEEPAPLPIAPGVAETISPSPKMHVLLRGDPHVPGEEVAPGVPTVLAASMGREEGSRTGDGKPDGGDRRELARWLTRPDNPLTARVIMNRLWQHHFGRGIVGTPNDFGRHGEAPTHPELLDWLALNFVAGGPENAGAPPTARPWSLKRMHRLMVLSNTYRQSSAPDAAKGRRDPDNHLLWRMSRQRLDAETLRDTILAASGGLTPGLGGPSIRIPLEPEVYDTIFTEGEPDNLWPVNPDPRQHTRRSIYLLRKRNVRLPLLVVFDAPDMMTSCGARGQSVHALQSLTLLNSEFTRSQSQALARRLLAEAPADVRDRIRRLFLLTLSRPPTPGELTATERFLADQTALLHERAARGETLPDLPGRPDGVDSAAAAAWIDLCLASLNLNEFVYVR